MDHRFYLSEVYGPHITSSPNHRAALPLVAAQTSWRVGGCRAFGRMDVMTGGAAHRRRSLVASTSLQQPHLVAMYIRVITCIDRARSEIPIQRLPWPIGERRSEFLAHGSVVTRAHWSTLRSRSNFAGLRMPGSREPAPRADFPAPASYVRPPDHDNSRSRFPE